MKLLVFVLEIKNNDISDGVIDKTVMMKSFEQCVDDLSKYDNVSGETNDGQNSFDGFRITCENVWKIAEAVVKC